MISEGRSGTDNVFSLRDGECLGDFCPPHRLVLTHGYWWLGILRLELGKETFERTGLSGKPIRGGGRKHAKERYRM